MNALVHMTPARQIEARLMALKPHIGGALAFNAPSELRTEAVSSYSCDVKETVNKHNLG